MLHDIEKRWAREEQPLFFLAFALHPKYRRAASALLAESEIQYGSWTKKKNCLSSARLIQAATFYYRKYELLSNGNSNESNKPKMNNLGKDLKRWLRGSSQLSDMDEFDSSTEDLVEWWHNQNVVLRAL
jgi:hypothetical protein